MPAETLRTFLTELCTGPILARPPDEPWDAMIARTSQSGVICAIDEETYDYFLEVLPPKYQGHGFAFAEGAEPLRYFWHRTPQQFLCRQLTWDETRQFCRLARIAPPS